MAALTLKVDESKLHPNTKQVVVDEQHGVLAELNAHGKKIVVHTLGSFITNGTAVWVRPAAAASVAPQAPAPQLPVHDHLKATVPYSQANIKTVYKSLELAMQKGCGNIDAATVLKGLKAAEV